MRHADYEKLAHLQELPREWLRAEERRIVERSSLLQHVGSICICTRRQQRVDLLEILFIDSSQQWCQTL